MAIKYQKAITSKQALWGFVYVLEDLDIMPKYHLDLQVGNLCDNHEDIDHEQISQIV
jgi:hypothetical protein